MPKKIAVIGAGPGGLGAAMLLASKGYKVDVYEKQTFVGGRNSSFQMAGYTFDVGPTFMSMPEIAEELFEEAGKNLHDYVELIELPMMYELVFPSKHVKMYRDPEKMKMEIERHYPGDSEGYERFMKETRVKMNALRPILQNKMDRYYEYLSFKILKALPQLSLGKSLYEVLSNYFHHEELKLGFTFQAKYLGMSPWECPGAFSILSFMEHEYGIFHPIGGVNKLSKALAQATEELGGTIHLGAGVKKLLINEQKDVKGLLLDDGRKIEADEVVINGDFSHVMSNLVEDGILKKYAPEKLAKKKYSCSTFMIYLGVNKKYDLPHHTISFSSDYKKNVEEITKTKLLSKDPSIYIQNASVTDPTLAPEGKSALYILAPVPNNLSMIDWEKNKEVFRDLVLDSVEEKTGFKGIREHIEAERMISPVEWEMDFNVYEGATFSLGHHLTQMMTLRPHNQFEELGNTWLVGGGTHPGSGLPTILESARITTSMLMQKPAKKKLNRSKPASKEAL
ncbi:phytoene desaturase family protein [Jeotgalibacillus campisalis]|uniref:Phytoene desaturase n=1 Tax=Jeotgalibacillus campisalis TaxID=220754 RepID=A0A0C2VTQ4_9BACL|nr:phytoene desaturase family protein [Jeotgalibacillus campisalis]KIL47373.1 phytoene desaturase [Jeotgalibacillus campisalis]